jgi:anti-sigma factor RsiW
MTDHDDIDDIDLLAYADDRLAGDPLRSRRVEAWLSTHPAAALKVRAYEEQNAALRRAYGQRLSEPVPDRLYRVIENTPPHLGPRLARFGAVAALMGLTAGLGWMAGQHSPAPDWAMDEFLQQSSSHYVSATRGPNVADRRPALSADWLAESVPPTLRVPELGKLGYAMTEKRMVETGSEPLVRLSYEGRQGNHFHLFLRPRWDAQATGVQLARKDGLSLAYWLDGPLASAIVAELPPEEALAIANAVREAMIDTRSTPAIPPTPPPSPIHKNIAGGAAEAALARETMPAAMTPVTPMPLGQTTDGK